MDRYKEHSKRVHEAYLQMLNDEIDLEEPILSDQGESSEIDPEEVHELGIEFVENGNINGGKVLCTSFSNCSALSSSIAYKLLAFLWSK